MAAGRRDRRNRMSRPVHQSPFRGPADRYVWPPSALNRFHRSSLTLTTSGVVLLAMRVPYGETLVWECCGDGTPQVCLAEDATFSVNESAQLAETPSSRTSKRQSELRLATLRQACAPETKVCRSAQGAPRNFPSTPSSSPRKGAAIARKSILFQVTARKFVTRSGTCPWEDAKGG